MTDLGATVTATPLIDRNGVVYVATDAGRIFALNSNTLGDKSGYDFPVDLLPTTPVTSLVLGDTNKLYAGGANGKLYAVTQ